MEMREETTHILQ